MFFNVVDFNSDPELEKVAEMLTGKKIPIMDYPKVSKTPLSEFCTEYLDVMCFPHLFPTVAGSMFTQRRKYEIKLPVFIKHYTKYADKTLDG